MVKPEMAEPGSITTREQGVERMIGRQAKVFSRRDLRHLRAAAKRGRFPLRDDVIVLLAARAGLRACGDLQARRRAARTHASRIAPRQQGLEGQTVR